MIFVQNREILQGFIQYAETILLTGPVSWRGHAIILLIEHMAVECRKKASGRLSLPCLPGKTARILSSFSL